MDLFKQQTSERTSRPPLIVSLFRALVMAFNSSRWLLVGALVTQVLAALGVPLQLALARVFVDRVAVSSPRQKLVSIAAVLVGLLLAQRLLALATGSLLTLARDHSAAGAVARYLDTASAIDAGHFNDPSFLDRMRHAGEVADARFSSVVFGISGLLGALAALTGLAALLASISPAVAALVLLSMVPWVLAEQRGFNIVRSARTSLLVHRRRQTYLRDLVTDPDTALELLASGAGSLVALRHRELTAEVLRLERPAHRRQFSVIALGSLIGGVMLAAAFVIAATAAIEGRATPGDIAAMVAALAAFLLTTGSLANSISGLLAHGPYLADYFDFLETPGILRTATVPAQLPERITKGVALANVTYTYPGADRPAVQGISLNLRPGELVALVGENGAGKSTLVKLLLRFYDPDGGSVSFDGIDLRDCDPRDVRSRVAVMFQDFARYQFSLRDGVAIGKPGEPVIDESVEHAIRAAGLGTLLESLPKKLDSQMGRMFPGGRGLSGGEWQRVALARLYYRNGEVLILDEPTSALDPRAETATFTEVRARLGKRVGLVISHRFSTVRAADRIGVMREGKLVEYGTHQALISSGGEYARLFESQAAGDRG